MNIEETLKQLESNGNMRVLPSDDDGRAVDLSSNDYLGLAERNDLRDEFFASVAPRALVMSSSASRLLGARQKEYEDFEDTLRNAYGRDALAFNSGYHANVGLIQALADKRTLVVADRLVHASIIDGIRLSGAPFERFRHNDYDHLERILTAKRQQYSNILIVAESVYSMDGDRCDVNRLVEAKRVGGDNTLLYIDEAHAVGVCGPQGLGLTVESGKAEDVDIMVGTLGKALASMGAYAIMSPKMRQFMINKARSLIFSTALPPINLAWSNFVFKKSLSMDAEREHLAKLGERLAAALGQDEASHIRPLIVGDPHKAVALSQKLKEAGYKVLPIRTPTVPPGTDRLRFSLSAALKIEDIEDLKCNLSKILSDNEA